MWGNPAQCHANMRNYPMASLKTRVTNTIRNTNNASKNLHVLLGDLLEHARDHGDHTELARLLNGLRTTATRVESILFWVEAFSPLNRGTTKDGKIKFSMPKNPDKRRQYMLDDAKKIAPWELTKEPVQKPFDLIKTVDAALKKYGKADEVKSVDPQDIDNMIAELTALKPKLRTA
jgi:hypothetical protein